MTTNRKAENTAISAKYAESGKEVVFGNGGGYVKGEGFKTLAQMRKETGVNMAATRSGSRMTAYGDYAIVAAINGRL